MGYLEDRQAERERWVRFREALVVEERQLDALAREAKRLAGATLEAAGYHQHARGVWRKKRRGTTCVTEAIETTAAPETESDRFLADQAIQDYIRNARKSEEAARKYFDLGVGNPVMASCLIKLHDGDMLKANEEALILRAEPEDLLRREAIRRRLAELRRDLVGPEPCSAVEQIIIDRAVLCWLATQDAEARVIHSADNIPQGFLQKRLDKSQARLLAVLKALDQIRRKTSVSHRLSVKVLGDLNLGSQAPVASSIASDLPMIESST